MSKSGRLNCLKGFKQATYCKQSMLNIFFSLRFIELLIAPILFCEMVIAYSKCDKNNQKTLKKSRRERKMDKQLSRRGFLGCATATSSLALMAGLTACSSDNDSTENGSVDESSSDQGSTSNSALETYEWEDEADVIILGTGAAGLSAAVTMGNENLGTAIILEAAPEEYNGGNSRVCGQGVFCPTTVEGAIAYQTDLNGEYVVDEDLIQAWAENICENIDWLTETVGFDAVEMGTAEFPEAESSDTVVWYSHEGGGPNAATWQLLKDAADSYGTTIYYEARGIELITNADGEVVGVTTEDGRNFKAQKGVILACGGFEANQEMMNMYAPIGMWGIQPNGTWYNRGDAVIMCEKLGAEMWHMNNFSGNRASIMIKDSADMTYLTQASFGSAHDFIIIGNDGNRFIYEETLGQARHGKLFRAGTWQNATLPPEMFMIFNQDTYDAGNIFTTSSFACRTDAVEALTTNDELLEEGIIVTCEAVADLASFTGLDEDVLQNTLDTYNEYADNNDDIEFHRGVESYDEGMALSHTSDNTSGYVNTAVEANIEAFDLVRIEAPYYCVKMFPAILNTQGGAKRSAQGEVMKVDGTAIPRLYSAGEFGTIYSYKYNLGGNFSEAISSGRVAARNCGALESWDSEEE